MLLPFQTAQQRVLICGGGVAALEAMLALRELAPGLVRVAVLAPEDEFVYAPAAVGGPFGAGHAERFALADLVERAGATLVRGELAAVDVDGHGVLTSEGAVIDYDSLLIACGARREEALPGAIAFAGPGDAARIEALLDELDAGRCRRVVFAVPAGVGWALPVYELALLTATHVASRGLDAHLTLVTPEEAPLAMFGREASDAVEALLAERGVRVHTRRFPIALYLSQLLLSPPQGMVPADSVVTVPRPAGRPISGLPQDRDGFVRTDAYGRVAGAEGRLRSRRHHRLPGQAGWPCRPAGRRGRRRDRRPGGRRHRAGAVQPGPARPPGHRRRSALPAWRPHRTARRLERGADAVVVARQQNCRALPGARAGARPRGAASALGLTPYLVATRWKYASDAMRLKAAIAEASVCRRQSTDLQLLSSRPSVSKYDIALICGERLTVRAASSSHAARCPGTPPPPTPTRRSGSAACGRPPRRGRARRCRRTSARQPCAMRPSCSRRRRSAAHAGGHPRPHTVRGRFDRRATAAGPGISGAATPGRDGRA
jgi:hypothetical protein